VSSSRGRGRLQYLGGRAVRNIGKIQTNKPLRLPAEEVDGSSPELPVNAAT
jgi:hypothetical protein